MEAVDMSNSSDPAASKLLDLPAVDSKEFLGLVALAVTTPYLFCLAIYRFVDIFPTRTGDPRDEWCDRFPATRHIASWDLASLDDSPLVSWTLHSIAMRATVVAGYGHPSRHPWAVLRALTR